MINGRPTLAIVLTLIFMTLAPVTAEALCTERSWNKAEKLDNKARKTFLSANKITDLRRRAELYDKAARLYEDARQRWDRLSRQCRGTNASRARENRSNAGKNIAMAKKKKKTGTGALHFSLNDMLKDAQKSAKKAKAECEKSPTCRHYKKGKQLLNNKRYREAIKKFDEVIGLDTTYDVAYVMKGIALTQLRKFKEDVSQFDGGMVVAKKRSKVWFWWPHYHKGIALLSLRKAKAARAEFSASIAVNPTANAYLGRAQTYMAERNAKRAQADIDQAVKLSPRNARLWSFKAGVHFVSGSTKLGCVAAKRACDLGDCRAAQEFSECKP